MPPQMLSLQFEPRKTGVGFGLLDQRGSSQKNKTKTQLASLGFSVDNHEKSKKNRNSFE